MSATNEGYALIIRIQDINNKRISIKSESDVQQIQNIKINKLKTGFFNLSYILLIISILGPNLILLLNIYSSLSIFFQILTPLCFSGDCLAIISLFIFSFIGYNNSTNISIDNQLSKVESGAKLSQVVDSEDIIDHLDMNNSRMEIEENGFVSQYSNNGNADKSCNIM